MAPYQNNLEHLRDELHRLDWLLERAVAQFRARRSADIAHEFRGLYISDEEIDELRAAGTATQSQSVREAVQEAACLRGEIQARISDGTAKTVALRLPHLATVFELNAFEYDVLLLALAPEIDLRYQKLYAYLQDDVTRKRPSVDLALRLLCLTLEERVQARQAFSETSPLLANLLLTLHADPNEQPAPLLGRFLKLEDRVAEFLLGSDRADPRLLTPLQLARWQTPRLTLDHLVLAAPIKETLQRFIVLAIEGHASRLLLHGPSGVGKKVAGETICQATGRPLLIVSLRELLKADTPPATLLRLAFREATLYRSALYLDGWQELLTDDPNPAALLGLAQAEMDRFPGLVFLGSLSYWQPLPHNSQRFFSVELPPPSEQQRQHLWEIELNHGTPIAPGIETEHLASAFRFTAGQIRGALVHAHTRAAQRDGPRALLTREDLLAGCRAEAVQRLGSFARKIQPQRVWQDLVLPKDTLAHLHEFCQQARRRVLVYDQWGFGRRLSLGKGLIALFSGSSGTGKTLSAEILAHELGLDLYRIDLSCVVSKYIGETEKNLSRVFAEAQESSAILFFDEADAIFGKRTEVKDAHDRYANIEINYLLQRVEEFEGVIILASNLGKNIDSAFLRRLHFAIEFPFPDEEHRLRIWRGIFPAETPLAADLDFEFLARKFKLAGGNIKNVALAAAFRASEDGGIIRMEHLILAMRREFQKLGKVCEKSDFERYYELVRG